MSTNTKKILWTKTGNQRRDWSDACVALSEFAGDTVEASFIAVKGSGPLGDIALDNVEFTTSCPSRFLHAPQLRSAMIFFSCSRFITCTF